MSLTFRGWLQLQTDREDGPIGELARAHARCSFTTAASFMNHLVHEHDEHGIVLATARVAAKRFRAYSRTRQLPSGRGP